MKRIIPLILCLLIVGTMLSAGFTLKTLAKPLNLEQEQIVEVLYGDSVYKLADKLADQDIFAYPPLLVWYARLFDMTNIKVGEYRVLPEMSALEILDAAVKGRVIEYKLTLIEGKTTAEVLKAIQASYGIVTTLDANDHAAILKAVGADELYQHSEGLFYPETYQYSKGTRDRDILQRAYTVMQKELEIVWQAAEGKNLPYKNAYELLVMASIIERETAVDEERRQIAGVFVQRLRQGMRLQTDPTVIYGMGDAYKGKITRRDLQTSTAYNTYTINGLPPTPIALSTRASLLAAADPLLNDKLYFVGKGNGYHHFSASLTEHNEAVRRYQLSRPADYRSTPLR